MPSIDHIIDRKIKSGAELLALRNSDKCIKKINQYLVGLHPQQILEWAIDHLPNLYQTTAFGLSGLVALDMISKISLDREKPHLVSLVFLDTLYHFDETLDLARRCVQTYGVALETFKPMKVGTSQEFEAEYGDKLWETDEDTYDYLVKVEPARRAYETLDVKSIITGRRRSQRGDRSEIPVLEIDRTGLIKLNPLAYWDFQQVWTYIRANEVPYNPLTDEGYSSIGDRHSTKKPHDSQTDNERAGRWSGTVKTECGLHKDYFQMRAAFMASKKKRELQKKLAQNVDESLSGLIISP